MRAALTVARTLGAGVLWLTVIVFAAARWADSAAQVQQPQAHRLLAPDGRSKDNFGDSLSLFGETLMIGAIGDDHLDQNAGSVYVFDRGDDGRWVAVQRLLALDGYFQQRFGSAVSISGETAIIGAMEDDERDLLAGAAYVFERDDGGIWVERQKLLPSDSPRVGFFGREVSISGDVAAIGAPYADSVERDSGSAYIFERQADGQWLETRRLVASDAAEGDLFGHSVSVSGKTVIVGATHQGFGGGTQAVYVFEPDADGAWVEVQKIDNPDQAGGDQFGLFSAISSGTIVVAAYGDDEAAENSGAAYVFERGEAGSWVEVQKLFPEDARPDLYFGLSAAIAGDRIVVGADGSNPPGDTSGSAYVFERDSTGVWRQVRRLLAVEGDRSDSFGADVAVSNDTVAVAARNADDQGNNSGAVDLYTLEGCTLSLGVEPAIARAGEHLTVTISLTHRRPKSVEVPFNLWIENERGAIVFERETGERTMRHGDQIRHRLSLAIPTDLDAGRYRVGVGATRMQQGVVWGTRAFEIVD